MEFEDAGLKYATTEQVALLDSALRARTTEEANAFVAQIAHLRPAHADDVAEAWARKQIAYWAGYFRPPIRARIEALYEQEHPLLGPAGKRFSVTELLSLGTSVAPGEFPYLLRSAPHPDEP